MARIVKLQGREWTPDDFNEIRGLIASNPLWHRRRLSEEVALRWNWRNGAGQLKDMAARTFLLKLETRGFVHLPPRRRPPTRRLGSERPASGSWDQTPLEAGLEDLQPLSVEEVSQSPPDRELLQSALRQFHYLGYGGSVGENLQYCLKDRTNRPLAFALFGAPAWKCQDRDRFIGWNVEQRERNLGLIANNARLLVLPWIRAHNLVSWFLGRIGRRIEKDWRLKYGHSVVVVETFVERDRFRGTAYRAANWRQVGWTTGRTRQDRGRTIQAPVKGIYLYPLRSNFREILCA